MLSRPRDKKQTDDRKIERVSRVLTVNLHTGFEYYAAIFVLKNTR